MRQQYKNEHWASCHNQTSSWYDWKIVESDVKPEQTNIILFAENVDLSVYFDLILNTIRTASMFVQCSESDFYTKNAGKEIRKNLDPRILKTD